jgi:hypothetical protein
MPIAFESSLVAVFDIAVVPCERIVQTTPKNAYPQWAQTVSPCSKYRSPRALRAARRLLRASCCFAASNTSLLTIAGTSIWTHSCGGLSRYVLLLRNGVVSFPRTGRNSLLRSTASVSPNAALPAYAGLFGNSEEAAQMSKFYDLLLLRCWKTVMLGEAPRFPPVSQS